jgi:hypothetical protein
MSLARLHDFLFPQIDGNSMSRYLLLLPWMAVLSSTAALTVSAQPAPQVSPPPSQAGQAPAAGYQSTLEGYQPFTDEKILPWKQANDTVGKIGGWRAYAREAHDATAKGDEAPNSTGPAPAPAKK